MGESLQNWTIFEGHFYVHMLGSWKQNGNIVLGC